MRTLCSNLCHLRKLSDILLGLTLWNNELLMVFLLLHCVISLNNVDT